VRCILEEHLLGSDIVLKFICGNYYEAMKNKEILFCCLLAICGAFGGKSTAFNPHCDLKAASKSAHYTVSSTRILLIHNREE
jgi:hypothetical protein